MSSSGHTVGTGFWLSKQEVGVIWQQTGAGSCASDSTGNPKKKKPNTNTVSINIGITLILNPPLKQCSGNLLTLNDPDSNISYAYDGANRIIQFSTVGSPNYPQHTNNYTYDLNGNRIHTSIGNFQFTYDALNRMTSWINYNPTGPWTFVYDELGRRIETIHFSGVRNTYTYDAKSQLKKVTNFDRFGGIISSFDYTYDSAGNRVSVDTFRRDVTVNNPLSYTYDDQYRVANATNPLGGVPEVFSYDTVGNRLISSLQPTDSVYDDANRLLENSAYTYLYDNNGNLISKTDKSTSETTTYSFDAENQLLQVSKPGTTVTFRYDGQGRRIEKNVNGTSIRRYIYDGDHVLYEYDGNNNFILQNRWGPGLDNYLMRSYIAGFNYIYMEDGLGSTTEVTDWHGNVRRAYVYDSFGNIVAQTNTLNPTNPYAYTGREFDEETGLYYYRARYYDPEIGRFLQEDPIGFNAGINFYTYVGNNPINFTDPFGLQDIYPFPDPGPPNFDNIELLFPDGTFCALGPFIVRFNASTNFSPQVFISNRPGFGGGVTYCYEVKCDPCLAQGGPGTPPPVMGFDTAFFGAGFDMENRVICVDIGPFYSLNPIPFPNFDFPIYPPPF